MMAFVDSNGVFDEQEFFRAVELATRIGLRQTNVDFDLPAWDLVQKRDRLTGVALSGVMDFETAVGWERTNEQPFDTYSISDNLAVLLRDAHYTAQQQALWYAHEMRVPAPLLTTTIKPSGTISKLPMISSGVHRSRAPYYIRRIRITASDPLAKVMLNAGFRVYPLFDSNNKLTESLFDSLGTYERAQILQNTSTWVVEFPVKSTTTIASSDESARDQFGRYLDFQRFWTDHNTSITIEFSSDEVNELIDMLLEHWDEYVAVSFMPKNTTAYPQLPEQSITVEEYNARAKEIQHIEQNHLIETLKDLERTNAMAELLDSDCVGGACPIR